MNKSEVSKNSLIIIDGYGFVFRAYHVQPPLLSPDGTPVGALYGFTSMLLKLINDFKPEKAVVVLDSGAKNFRHEIYKEYKANRPPAPDDLVIQLKLIREAAESLNFPVLEKPGFEADDIIATLACIATDNKKDAIIVSSDKDLMQLINSHVRMYDPVKARFMEIEDVEKKFCVGPDKVRDVQALMGDKSDNIPGVAGIGPKTAAQLINQFNDLEGIYESIDQIKSANQRQKLLDSKADAFMSYQLVGLDNNVEIDAPLDQLLWSAPATSLITNYLHKYGFKSLIKRASSAFDIQISESSKAKSIDNKVASHNKIKMVQKKEICSLEDLQKMVESIEESGTASIFWNILDNDNHLYIAHSINQEELIVNLIDFSKYNQKNENIGENLSLFDQPGSDAFGKIADNIHDSDYFPLLSQMFSDPSIIKITHDLKGMMKNYSCNIKSAHDLMLMQYTLNPSVNNKDIYKLLSTYFDVDESSLQADPTICCQYFSNLFTLLKKELIESKLYSLYIDIDLPVCSVLHDMEAEGVRIDKDGLSKLSVEFDGKAKELESKIIAIAGQDFNVASPAQLGSILFDKLSLPHGKITSKSGSYGTGSEILEKLSADGYEIANLILEYRHYTKLKNTYTDSLPKLANKESSRIHTTYLQNHTSTGRLSSRDPNVQNIPIRSDEGNKIRQCFIAKPEHKLISADYSQIELRILSHVADIPALKQAFLENRDIHSQTASQIFGVAPDKVDSEMRRKAKAINFGIIYGISAFGLAKQINCSRGEAADYIKKYFEEYPGIEEYMSKTVEFARQEGYVKNIFGRRCYLPNINSKNHSLKSYAERAAINAPLQGLNADIIKIAMIELGRILRDRGYKAKMILQIHDELIFEAPTNEVEVLIPIIKSTMEQAISMSVPASVEVRSGNNWYEIH